MSTRKPAPTVESYAKVNAECARIILDDPLKYPPDGLMARWAEAHWRAVDAELDRESREQAVIDERSIRDEN